MNDLILSNEGGGDGVNDDYNTKKHRFKEVGEDLDGNMAVDSTSVSGSPRKINC